MTSGVKAGQAFILLHEGALDSKISKPSADLIGHLIESLLLFTPFLFAI